MPRINSPQDRFTFLMHFKEVLAAKAIKPGSDFPLGPEAIQNMQDFVDLLNYGFALLENINKNLNVIAAPPKE
jgi:hypothetical protein